MKKFYEDSKVMGSRILSSAGRQRTLEEFFDGLLNMKPNGVVIDLWLFDNMRQDCPVLACLPVEQAGMVKLRHKAPDLLGERRVQQYPRRRTAPQSRVQTSR